MFNTAEGQVAQHPSGAGPEAQNHSLDEILFGLSCEFVCKMPWQAATPPLNTAGTGGEFQTSQVSCPGKIHAAEMRPITGVPFNDLAPIHVFKP